ncbi:MAG: hypothetical protein ACRD0U_10225, partial [Acidimicrobiales bacterium]
PPAVWRIDGRRLEPARPAPFPAPSTPAPEALASSSMLTDLGAEVVIEHGVVTGQILGLVIARVVLDDRGMARLEVGVGRHDREAFALIHGDQPNRDAVADVADAVRRVRHAGGPEHPLRHLAAGAWLRDVVVAKPDLAGAVTLDRIEGPAPRNSLKDVVPAAAAGQAADGQPLVVVCSVGVDVDLVPWAADARAGHDASARLVLVVPERDDHALTRALARTLREPAQVVTAPNQWREVGPSTPRYPS